MKVSWKRVDWSEALHFGLHAREKTASCEPVSEPSCRLSFKVVPGASRDEIAGQHGEAIRVKLRAPPVDGRANAALVSFLAKRLGLRATDLQVITGATSRLKLVGIAGLNTAEARRRLLSAS
jgi:uncharacterized protein (TIGR00251 family)